MIKTLRHYYQRFEQRRNRRTYIVPTRFGAVFVAFLLLMLLGAINYSNSLGHLLVFLLVSLGNTAMLYSNRNLAKLELKHVHAENVFLGQQATVQLVFLNPNNYHCHQIDVANKPEQIVSGNFFKRMLGYLPRQSIALLESTKTTTSQININTTHRGKQTLGSLRLSSEFPLGLFFSWTYFPTTFDVLVYPKPEGILPLPNTSGLSHKQSLKQQKGLDDFAGFNSYRAGEPIHSIAWKALARDDVLRTKQFSSPLDGRLTLSWQDTNSLKGTEARLSQLCQWILEAEKSGLNYGLSLPNKNITVAYGDSHRRQCLTALALYHAN